MAKKSWQLTKKDLVSLREEPKDGPAGRYGRTPASTKDAKEMREKREAERLAREKERAMRRSM